MPPWLWLLLAGITVGAGAVLFVQERHLPPRLSAEASARLTTAFNDADAQRSKSAAELLRVARQLAAAQQEKDSLANELTASRATAERLQGDLASVVESLPPDPRKGQVEVRAARFATAPGLLAYDLVLTRERAAGKPLVGTVQLVVTGDPAPRGEASSVNLKPIALSMGRQQVVRGSVPLPAGFRPRQTTVQVVDRAGGKVVGMRIWALQ